MPVFDGLFPEPHNQSIQELLFTCAHWHGLAKLRMHTEKTLEILEETTVNLGALFRLFTTTICPAYTTRELAREAEARKRRESKNLPQGQAPADSTASITRRQKDFNMATYKYHSLSDYANTIRRYGTCDSYSTELVRNTQLLVHRVYLRRIVRANWNIVHQRQGMLGQTASNI